MNIIFACSINIFNLILFFKDTIFLLTYTKSMLTRVPITQSSISQFDIQYSSLQSIKTLRLNGHHFLDALFKCTFLYENCCILMKISLKFVSHGPIIIMLTLVWIMVWHRPGDKPLSEPMVVSLYASLSLIRLTIVWVYDKFHLIICIAVPKQSYTPIAATSRMFIFPLQLIQLSETSHRKLHTQNRKSSMEEVLDLIWVPW